MKMAQRFFLLGTSLFTFFCFCFPWIDGESGFHLIVGEGAFLIPSVFLIALLVIACLLFWQSRILIFVFSLVGIIFLMVLLFNNLLFIEYGLSLTIVGFFLLMAGVRFFPIPD
ncbi:hypothetical protein JT359_19870 [Candidatus Poribacteria bacterium]|nr:hypothetical protein [Candidatus Poribacteria bacterium]